MDFYYDGAEGPPNSLFHLRFFELWKIITNASLEAFLSIYTHFFSVATSLTYFSATSIVA